MNLELRDTVAAAVESLARTHEPGIGQQLQPLALDKRLQNIDHTITLVDGSLIAALPRIMEASFRKATTGSGMIKWRLHTHFEPLRGVPTRIDVHPDGGGPHILFPREPWNLAVRTKIINTPGGLEIIPRIKFYGRQAAAELLMVRCLE